MRQTKEMLERGHIENIENKEKRKRTDKEGDLRKQDDATDLPAVVPEQQSQRERELQIMRKVMRKWWRLAGLPGHPRMCEEKGEEFGVLWTKGIAPRLEGRIKIIGESA